MTKQYYLSAMEQSLSEGDKQLLKEIYEPMVVAVPPEDGFNSVSVMPDGEIRIYGRCNKKEERAVYTAGVGQSVYISSRDCGLSWKKVLLTNDSSVRRASYNPETGRFIEIITYNSEKSVLGRNFKGINELEKGCLYAFICDGGVDSDINKVVKITDGEKNFLRTRQVLFLKHRNRCIFCGQYKDEITYLFAAVSDDDGDSWKIVKIDHDLKAGQKSDMDKGERWQNYCCEPDIAELSDGTLVMMIRTTTDYYYISYSYDGGDSWEKPSRSVFHGTNTTPSIMKLSDGRMLFFWCNTQILPELNQRELMPKLDQEIVGKGEDYFTNRDANHIAISEDDGKSWQGARELYLNDIRNSADYRSAGGVVSCRDKSVQQAQMLELPFNKVLVHFGQNEISRKVLIFDIDWLYEKKRKEDFKTGLENVSTHMFVKSNPGYYRGFSGHCAFNRTNGALLVPDPDNNFEEALCVARVRDKRLLYEKQGAVWNFPAAIKGEVSVKMKVIKNGVYLSVSDHWYNPCDEYAPLRSHISVKIDKDVAPAHKWTEIKIAFDTEENYACIYADGMPICEKKITREVSVGLCYLHIQTLANEEDFEGTLIKSMEFEKNK